VFELADVAPVGCGRLAVNLVLATALRDTNFGAAVGITAGRQRLVGLGSLLENLPVPSL